MSDKGTPGEGLTDIEALDEEYVFGTWSFRKEASPTEVNHSEGIRFTDARGDEVIDFSSQLMCSNLGHPADDVTDAMEDS